MPETDPPLPSKASRKIPADPPTAPSLVDALALVAGPSVTRRPVGVVPAVFALGVDADRWTVVADTPLDRLVGWRAPPSARAVAVVTSARILTGDTGNGTSGSPPGLPEGRSASVQSAKVQGAGVQGVERGGVERAGAERGGVERGGVERGGVEVAVAVDRSGAACSRLTVEGRVEDHPPSGGRLLDGLRRSLDLATPPPPEDTVRLLAVLWLAQVVRVTTVPTSNPAPTWCQVLRSHPAVRLLLDLGERLRQDQMERIVAISPSTWTWDVLREAESSHGAVAPLCPPGAAGWMDDGMYARWVLSDLPSLGYLHTRVAPRLSPAVLRRLERTLYDNGALGPADRRAAVAC